MEGLIYILVGILVGSLLAKVLAPIKRKDRNLYSNGGRNSFLQADEDRRYYSQYERKRLKEDVEKYRQEFINTKAFIAKKPYILSIITPERCLPLEEEYNRYIEIQKKLCLDNIILSREEFLIKKENPVYCAYISVSSPFLGLYSVYDDKTVRYANNAKEVLKKDFSDKWY